MYISRANGDMTKAIEDSERAYARTQKVFLTQNLILFLKKLGQHIMSIHITMKSVGPYRQENKLLQLSYIYKSFRQSVLKFESCTSFAQACLMTTNEVFVIPLLVPPKQIQLNNDAYNGSVFKFLI